MGPFCSSSNLNVRVVITDGLRRTTETVFTLSHLISRLTDVARGCMSLSPPSSPSSPPPPPPPPSPSSPVVASALVGHSVILKGDAAFRVDGVLSDKLVVAFLCDVIHERGAASIAARKMTTTATMRAFGIGGVHQSVMDTRMELAMLTRRWLSLLSPVDRADFHGMMFRYSAGLYFLRMFNLRGLKNATTTGGACVQEWKTGVRPSWTIPVGFTRDTLCKWKAALESLNPSVCSNFDFVVAIPSSHHTTGDITGIPMLPTYDGMLPGESMCVAVLLARLALQTPRTPDKVRHTDIVTVCLYVRLSSVVCQIEWPPMACSLSRWKSPYVRATVAKIGVVPAL